jgi:hypothetical protein
MSSQDWTSALLKKGGWSKVRALSVALRLDTDVELTRLSTGGKTVPNGKAIAAVFQEQKIPLDYETFVATKDGFMSEVTDGKNKPRDSFLMRCFARCQASCAAAKRTTRQRCPSCSAIKPKKAGHLFYLRLGKGHKRKYDPSQNHQ